MAWDEPRRTRPHLERGARWSLCEGVCQQEYVVHADAQRQERQHPGGAWGQQLEDLSSPAVGPKLSDLAYLGSGSVEGNAQQGTEPQARGHRQGHQYPSEAHCTLGLGTVPPQHRHAG